MTIPMTLTEQIALALHRHVLSLRDRPSPEAIEQSNRSSTPERKDHERAFNEYRW